MNGFILLCDPSSNILEILRNTDEGILETSESLTKYLNPSDVYKFLNFLMLTKREGSAFGWELALKLHDNSVTLNFTGMLQDSNILITATETADWLYEEMIKINSDYTNLFRSYLKGLINNSLSKKEPQKEDWDEVSRLNNELINMQRDLAKTNKELERTNANNHVLLQRLKLSNRELSDFGSIISHDLKNPLISIVNFLKILEIKHPDLDEETVHLMKETDEISMRMITMIEDLLEFSRIDANIQEFTKFSFQDTLENVLDNLDYLIKETKTQIVHRPLPEYTGNSVQMMRVFQNLIQNSIRYRGENAPIIQITARETSDYVKINFIDNGIGISLEDQSRIFEIFKRGRNQENSGSGIGLSVCKKIITLHGGSISVESELGKGATFTISLPKKYQPGSL